jgi:hypothetical protein
MISMRLGIAAHSRTKVANSSKEGDACSEVGLLSIAFEFRGTMTISARVAYFVIDRRRHCRISVCPFLGANYDCEP